jgi:hypothetical protein
MTGGGSISRACRSGRSLAYGIQTTANCLHFEGKASSISIALKPFYENTRCYSNCSMRSSTQSAKFQEDPDNSQTHPGCF